MTEWGGWSGHLRVGIDVSQSPSTPSHSTTSVTVTVRYYVQVDSWVFDDNQTLNLSGSIDGAVNFHNDLSGTNASMLVATRTLPVGISFNSRPQRTFAAELSGVYNGASPSKSVTYTAPYRPAAAPSRPGTPSVDPASNGESAEITWAAPSDNNGASVDTYQIQVDNNSSFTSPVLNGQTSGRSWNTSTVEPGRTYYARVRAHNSAGWSDWSGTRTFSTPAQPPSRPSTPSVGSITATSAAVSWAAPAANGDAIDSYQLRLTGGTVIGHYTDSASPRTLTGLTRATNYGVEVRAHNSAGWSDWSGARSFKTDSLAPDPPGAPTFIDVAATTVGFRTSLPSDNGGASITNVRWRYAANASMSGAVTVSPGSWQGMTVQGLLPGTTYYVQAAAYNSIGWSDWSVTATFRTLSGVKVGNGATWIDAVVYVGDDVDWVLAEVHTGSGTSWN